MDAQQFELGFTLSFACLFVAGFFAWGISAITRFFKMLSGG